MAETLPRNPRRRRSAAPPTPHRALRAQVLTDLLAKGTPVPAPTVDLVIAAGERLTGRPPARWTRDDVEALAWYGLLDHAHEMGAPLDGLAPAALQLAEVLDPDGRRGLVDAMAGMLDPAAAGDGDRHPTLRPA